MSNGAYAGLRLAARASNQDPDNDPKNEPDGDGDEATPPKGKNKDKKPMDNNCNETAAAEASGYQRGVAEASAAANKRFADVIGSEHYAGREKLAHKMLGNFNLSAADIIGCLAESPAGGAQASGESAEDAARSEMKTAMKAAGNSSIDASGGGSSKDAKAEDHSAIWDAAIASNNPRLGRK